MSSFPKSLGWGVLIKVARVVCCIYLFGQLLTMWLGFVQYKHNLFARHHCFFCFINGSNRVLCFGAYAISGDGVVGMIFFEVLMIPNASPNIIQKTYCHIKQLGNGLTQCWTLVKILLFATDHYVIVCN